MVSDNHLELAPKPTTTPHFDFFGLPRELRNLIYEFYAQEAPQRLAIRRQIRGYQPGWKALPRSSTSPPALVLANRQTNTEYLEAIQLCQKKILVLDAGAFSALKLSSTHNADVQGHTPDFSCTNLATTVGVDWAIDSHAMTEPHERGYRMVALISEINFLLQQHATKVTSVTINGFSLDRPPILTLSLEAERYVSEWFVERVKPTHLPNLQVVRVKIDGLDIFTLRKIDKSKRWYEKGDAEFVVKGTYTMDRGTIVVKK